jgi:hypothetical protein
MLDKEVTERWNERLNEAVNHILGAIETADMHGETTVRVCNQQLLQVVSAVVALDALVKGKGNGAK